jgi:hypothetical protein
VNSLEAKVLHAAIFTALKITEDAVLIARQRAPMGITPIVLEAADKLSEALTLADKILADSTEVPR